MRILAYEGRRLAGVRSTWLVLLATLTGAAVLTVLENRHTSGAVPSAVQAARRLTAVPPLLPLPLAAFGAGILGSLSYVHELRHPALCAALVPARHRLRLLGAKMVAVGAVAVALVGVSALVDAAVLRAVASGGTGGSGPASGGHAASALLAAAVLAVAAGWTGLLASGLVRSAVGGALALPGLAVLPGALERVTSGLSGRGGAWSGALTAGAAAPLVAAGAAAVLLAAWTAVQLGCRSL